MKQFLNVVDRPLQIALVCSGLFLAGCKPAVCAETLAARSAVKGAVGLYPETSMKEMLEKTATLNQAIGTTTHKEHVWVKHTISELEKAAPGMQRTDFTDPADREKASKDFEQARSHVLDGIKDVERVCD